MSVDAEADVLFHVKSLPAHIYLVFQRSSPPKKKENRCLEIFRNSGQVFCMMFIIYSSHVISHLFDFDGGWRKYIDLSGDLVLLHKSHLCLFVFLYAIKKIQPHNTLNRKL